MSDEDEYLSNRDNLNYKSISCENIPEIFLDKLVAKEHFSQFGKINRFILRPKRLSCTVEYQSEEDAEKAFLNAGVYKGIHFDIKFSANEVGHTKSTEEWVDLDQEVQSELDAMGYANRKRPRGAVLKPTVPKPTKPIKTKPVFDGTSRVFGNTKSQLESVLRSQTFSVEDKYRVLDARDKLIRLVSKRTTDIKQAADIIGTCPDMCPEKERLMREAKRQVSLFEMSMDDANSMDHSCAVKEYCRSSADQEIPLAHELRPESVLRMTMNYLLQNIMDVCEEPETNIGEWYHFLWDRTRSIRKDITQQDLCSQGAVDLVEQCARFHVHCAGRLVAEEAMVFDHKINTENLTKCLQSLKYMYHDLRLKNVTCKNEPEFRAYVVLLNLNDSNFLWEIKQLPTEIQNSPELRFALEVYLAMANNNYIKFFRCVRKTSYMNACILLRYFTQVRIQAMKTIIKAYNWPRHSVGVSLAYLTEILAFEAEEESVQFFQYYGLPIESDKVMLDRASFNIPDVPIDMERSRNVVEAKRETTVGEAVCGRQLDSSDEAYNHVVEDSFDEYGYLKPSAFDVDVNLKYLKASKKPQRSDEPDSFKVPIASRLTAPKFSKPGSVSAKNEKPVNFNFLESLAEASKEKEQSFPKQTFGLSFGTPNFNMPANQTTDNKSTGFNPVQVPLFTQPEKEPPPPPLFTQPSDDTSLFTKPVFGSSLFTKSSTTGDAGGFRFKPVVTEVKPSSTPPQVTFSFSNLSNNTTNETKKLFPPKSSTDTSNNALELPASQNENKLPSFLPEKIITETPKLPQQKSLLFNRVEPEKFEPKKRIPHKQQEKSTTPEKIDKEKELLMEKNRQIELSKKRKEEALKKKAKIFNLSSELVDNLIHDHVRQHTKDLVREELERYESILSLSNEEVTKLLDECVLTELRKLAASEIQLYKQMKHWKLKQISPDFSPSASKTEEIITPPMQNETLKLGKRYRKGLPENLKTDVLPKNRINILDTFQKVLTSKLITNNQGLINVQHYIKIIISIPDEKEEPKGFGKYISNWLNKTLVRQEVKNTKNVFFCESKDNVSVCLRKIRGATLLNENGKKSKADSSYAHGIVFMMTGSNFQHSRKRLHTLVKLSHTINKIPVYVMIYNSSLSSDTIRNNLKLDHLVQENLLSHYCISTHTRSNEESLNTFTKVMEDIGRTLHVNSELEMQQMKSFLSTTIGPELWRRFEDTWTVKLSFRKYCENPNRIVLLYNDAVERLLEVFNECLEDYPEFPNELKVFVPQVHSDIPLPIEYFPKKWNCSQRNIAIREFIEKLKLTRCNFDFSNFENFEKSLCMYTKVCVNDDSFATKMNYNALKNLPEHITSMDSLCPDDIFWINIIKSIALDVLTYHWKMESSLPKEAIYKKFDYNNYMTNPWWIEDKYLNHIGRANVTEHSILMIPEEDLNQSDDIDLNSIFSEGSNALKKADEIIKNKKRMLEDAPKYDEEIETYDETQTFLTTTMQRCILHDNQIEEEELRLNENLCSSQPKKLKISPYDDFKTIINKGFAIASKAENLLNNLKTQKLKNFNNNLDS